MDVFIDLWSPKRDLETARTLAESASRNHPAALMTLVDAGAKGDVPVGVKAVIDPAHKDSRDGLVGLDPTAIEQIAERAADSIPGFLEVGADGRLNPVTHIESTGAPRVFVDPIVGAQRLIIAGAGHIAQPLAALGSMIGFHVTVIDDRASFANRERFPTADEIIVKPFKAAIDTLRLDRHCYVVSVTRGHAFDEEVLRAALKQAAGVAGKEPGPFIGMIGSRRRVKAALARIEEDGVDPKLLDEVHAPLGVDIGAETPAEIAVAIIAEIIREWRIGKRDAFNLGTKVGRLRRDSQS